jgi:hypothetical protein
MGFLDKITKPFQDRKLKNEQLLQLRELLVNAVSDLELTDQELLQIKNYFADSKLNAEDFAKIRDEAFMHAVNLAMVDKRVSFEELTALDDIALKLGISRLYYEKIRSGLGIYYLLDTVEKGILPEIEPESIILQKNEIAHIEVPSFLLEERVVSRQYTGRSQGVSFRIMKGVSYRVGATRGQLLTQTGIVNVSDGTFVITNKRIIFSGNRKSFNSSLEKILDIQLYNDALQISLTNRQKPVIVGMYSPQTIELCGTLISHLLND